MHVLSKNFTSALVNEFGARLTKSLRSTLLYSDKPNPGHGAFVESCTHHCTSCSNKREDSWNGPSIVSSVEKVNEATAFAAWYRKSLGGSGATSSGSSAVATNNTNFYFQDRAFPCYDCCVCRIYK